MVLHHPERASSLATKYFIHLPYTAAPSQVQPSSQGCSLPARSPEPKPPRNGALHKDSSCFCNQIQSSNRLGSV